MLRMSVKLHTKKDCKYIFNAIIIFDIVVAFSSYLKLITIKTK